MGKYLFFILLLSSSITFADAVAYGGRHEIAIDGWNGSIRHVHNWGTKKNKELYLDFKNHHKFFTAENDFSYVEFIDRRGKVQFNFPSPAYSKLWSYKDSLYVGLSNIKLYNPFQIVVWNSKGKVLYKAHFSREVAKFTAENLSLFKSKFPQAHEHLKNNLFIYEDVTYCDFSYLGGKIGKDAQHFLSGLKTRHPYVRSSGSVLNWINWYSDEKEPEFERGKGRLTIHLKYGKPLVIKLSGELQQTNAW